MLLITVIYGIHFIYLEVWTSEDVSANIIDKSNIKTAGQATI